MYRLTFGKHENKTLQEVPPDYRKWLISDNVYADKEDLKAALIAGGYLSDPFTPPSTPTRKRPLAFDSETPISPSRKVAISRAARRNGTMLNYDGSAYILDFGKHAGAKLSDVPEDYIDWLIRKEIPAKRPDLADALRELGMLSAGNNIAITTYTVDRPAWKVPSIHETSDARFFDPHSQTPRWISDADASRYFRLEEPLLSTRGLFRVSEDDVKRETQFGELVSVTKGPKRWLYPVFACAMWFGSVPPERGTVDDALRDFLAKNRRREVVFDV